MNEKAVLGVIERTLWEKTDLNQLINHQAHFISTSYLSLAWIMSDNILCNSTYVIEKKLLTLNLDITVSVLFVKGSPKKLLTSVNSSAIEKMQKIVFDHIKSMLFVESTEPED